MEMWCPDVEGRDSWGWVGFKSPEWEVRLLAAQAHQNGALLDWIVGCLVVWLFVWLVGWWLVAGGWWLFVCCLFVVCSCFCHLL